MNPLRGLAALILGAVLCTGLTTRAEEEFTRTEVIYGRKFGTALTMDVIQPKQSNRCAVLFMVSGGFFSSHEAINPGYYKPFLSRGYTVFAVVHGSQPRFVIPEIEQDIHRAVRFVRHNASTYGIDPDKFGITGGSAGGHLSLIMGTQGRPGDPQAKDSIDRESSAVQAVACFFPPTDFHNWGGEGIDAVGVGPLAQFKPAFGARSETAESRTELSHEISPIHYITSKMAPALIIHGDSDKLVPVQQAYLFRDKAKELNAVCKVIVKEGKDHGWPHMEVDEELFADWFDQYLRSIKK
jgi:acetyl esterase/lipase